MVEGARLESVYALTRIAGSNPALSAILSATTTAHAIPAGWPRKERIFPVCTLGRLHGTAGGVWCLSC